MFFDKVEIEKRPLMYSKALSVVTMSGLVGYLFSSFFASFLFLPDKYASTRVS